MGSEFFLFLVRNECLNPDKGGKSNTISCSFYHRLPRPVGIQFQQYCQGEPDQEDQDSPSGHVSGQPMRQEEDTEGNTRHCLRYKIDNYSGIYLGYVQH